ncbi:Transmembrane protein 223 [Frankliniella fusca]|uniref:Transmembrane protein 223 n=1 Tax=Frankliniella fusca TaxID=407009 RepID=A0AAE1I5P7_9NEOP|nr:Transmembrane protein 223 [Frankliniella fusca]
MNQSHNIICNMRNLRFCRFLIKGQFVSCVVGNITSRTCYKLLQCREVSRSSGTQIRNYSSNARGSSFRSSRSSESVVLYTNDNLKFLRMVNLFGLSFTLFWCATSYQFATMRITPQSEKINLSHLPWFAQFDIISSSTTKFIATFVSVLLGAGVFCGAWMYSIRSVGQVILGKGGKSVTFVTYNPLAFRMNKKIHADLNDISCQGHRSVNDVLPIKVKGRWMHFLVSREGIYHNGPLFDQTVGLRRQM